MVSLEINKKSEERASSKNHLRTMETGDTLTLGPPQTEEKIFFCQESFCDSEEEMVMRHTVTQSFTTPLRLLKISHNKIFFSPSVSQLLLWEKIRFSLMLTSSCPNASQLEGLPLRNHHFPQFEAETLLLLDLLFSCFS